MIVDGRELRLAANTQERIVVADNGQILRNRQIIYSGIFYGSGSQHVLCGENGMKSKSFFAELIQKLADTVDVLVGAGKKLLVLLV